MDELRLDGKKYYGFFFAERYGLRRDSGLPVNLALSDTAGLRAGLKDVVYLYLGIAKISESDARKDVWVHFRTGCYDYPLNRSYRNLQECLFGLRPRSEQLLVDLSREQIDRVLEHLSEQAENQTSVLLTPLPLEELLGK